MIFNCFLDFCYFFFLIVTFQLSWLVQWQAGRGGTRAADPEESLNSSWSSYRFLHQPHLNFGLRIQDTH